MGLALLDREKSYLAAPTKTTSAPARRLRVVETEPHEPAPLVPAVPGALAQARRLVESNPGSGAMLARLARAELDISDRSLAVHWATSALEIAQADRAAFTVAIQVLLQCGRADLAAMWMDEIGRAAGRERVC